MGDWNGSVVPDSGDIVLRTSEKEFLRLKPNGTFFVDGRPSDDAQIVKALRWWLTGTGATSWLAGHSLKKDIACHRCWEHITSGSPLGCQHDGVETTAVIAAPPGRDLVLGVAPGTAVAVQQQSIQFRARAALEALRASIKEREDTRTKAIASLAELLATFQRVMRPFVVELGLLAKTLGQERPSALFDAGNTLCIDGIFGMEWAGGEYVLYHGGNRRAAGAGEVAVYIVDHQPGLDVEAAMNKIASGLEAARDNIAKGLGTYEKIRATAVGISKRLKDDEAAMPKALTSS